MYSKVLQEALIRFCQKNIGFFDYQESVICRIYRAIIRAGDIVVDGGAHAGRHTSILASCVGKSGRVYAVEALPFLAARLADSFKKNPAVKVVSKALFDQSKDINFRYVKNNPSYSGINVYDKLSDAEIEEITVPAATLDSILADETNCRLIKLDLEGAEFLALSGAKKILSDFCPIILFENALGEAAFKYKYSKQHFFSLFSEHGYQTYDLFGEPINDLLWEEGQTYFDNFIASKTDEDNAFVQENMPEILFSTLLEMNEMSVKVGKNVSRIMTWFSCGYKIILFGAGNRAKLVLSDYSIPFVYIVDNDSRKWGKKLAGLSIKNPLLLDREDKEKIRIVILSLWSEEIKTQLEGLGFDETKILDLGIK